MSVSARQEWLDVEGPGQCCRLILSDSRCSICKTQRWPLNASELDAYEMRLKQSEGLFAPWLLADLHSERAKVA